MTKPNLTPLGVADEVIQISRALCREKLSKINVPPSIVRLFAAIATGPGRLLSDIERPSGLVKAVVSHGRDMFGVRIITYRAPGLDWIAMEPDPANKSRKVVTLTGAEWQLVERFSI